MPPRFNFTARELTAVLNSPRPLHPRKSIILGCGRYFYRDRALLPPELRHLDVMMWLRRSQLSLNDICIWVGGKHPSMLI